MFEMCFFKSKSGGFICPLERGSFTQTSV
uniref:Uncharacterized protein n=1 Tax=Anguilla anguilla TaxID=7936 RepID=A0A0E9T673_ANGAN